MRRVIPLLLLLVANGCECAGQLVGRSWTPASQACGGKPCPNYPEALVEARALAARECGRETITSGRCREGGTYIDEGGNLYASSRYYDDSGALLGRRDSNDTDRVRLAGTRLDCERTQTLDLCAELVADGGVLPAANTSAKRPDGPRRAVTNFAAQATTEGS